SAFSARDNQWRRRSAIEEDGKINLASDLNRFRNQDRVHHLAGWASLMGDQCLSQHLLGDVTHFGGGLATMDAPPEAVGKRSLPSPAGVNLRLDDQIVCRQFTRNFLRLIRGARSFPSWRGDAKLLEQLFSLVLVNVHRGRVALSAR